MANFSTSMQEWSGAFAPPSTVSADKSSDAWGQAAAALVPKLLDAAGTGYAQAKGENILGGATTEVEAQEAVAGFDEEVIFEEDPANTADQNAQIRDMRNAALKKFGTDDKKIQALVTAGKISSLEANARRHQMLQESLSNPVLAMFKEDFLEASKPFTGGSGKLAEQYFGAYLPTEEERVQMEAVDKVVTEKAKFEAQVVETMNNFGITREQAEFQIRELNAEAQELKRLENENKKFKFKAPKAYSTAMDVVDYNTKIIGARIAAIAQKGQKLSGDEIQKLVGELEASKQAMLGGVGDYLPNMERADRVAVEKAIDDRIEGFKKMLNESDGLEFLKRQVDTITSRNDIIEQRGVAQLIAVSPKIYAAFKMNPEYGDLVMKAEMGDASGEFGIKTNPYFRTLSSQNPHTNWGALGSESFDKITNNDATNWTAAHGASFYAETVRPGNTKGAIGAHKAAPDAANAALVAAFANPSVSLAPMANSKEWEVAAKTPEGAKTVAANIRAARDTLIGMNVANTAKMSEPLAIKEILDIDIAGQELTHYAFNIKGLPDVVQDRVIQTYKILKKNPHIVKELGANSVEEYIASYLKP
jgi:hypothetical protein